MTDRQGERADARATVQLEHATWNLFRALAKAFVAHEGGALTISEHDLLDADEWRVTCEYENGYFRLVMTDEPAPDMPEHPTRTADV
jgi:hypothetical protein